MQNLNCFVTFTMMINIYSFGFCSNLKSSLLRIKLTYLREAASEQVLQLSIIEPDDIFYSFPPDLLGILILKSYSSYNNQKLVVFYKLHTNPILEICLVLAISYGNLNT